MLLVLHIIVTYIKENIKLQKLNSLPRNLRVDNKSAALFVNKPLSTGDLLPACKIFIERPEMYNKESVIVSEPRYFWGKLQKLKPPFIMWWKGSIYVVSNKKM